MAVLTTAGITTLYTTRFTLMGGPARVQFIDERGRSFAESTARAAEDEARRIEVKFSRYREDSVISTINRAAGRMPVAVDDETVELVQAALGLAALTAGRFDPTSGVLRRAWDFRAARIPSSEQVAALLPLIDAGAVQVKHGTVFLRRPGMELDLGGVGKEYAVDRVAELLRERGIRAGIVNFAGDVRTVGGRDDGRPWSIGVVDPQRRDRCRFAVRMVGDAGIATSGNYERAFEVDGVRYHHLLDATTGWPARGVTSTTVVASKASVAGRLATAAFLLGAEAGLTLLERTPGVEGALILENGGLRVTSGMARCSNLPGGLYAAYPAI